MYHYIATKKGFLSEEGRLVRAGEEIVTRDPLPVRQGSWLVEKDQYEAPKPKPIMGGLNVKKLPPAPTIRKDKGEGEKVSGNQEVL